MGALGGPLVFPLGGEGLSGGKPWIVNLAPSPDGEQVKLLRPIRFTVRDSESFVDPGQLLVEVGYAKVHSDASELFDKLPRTKRFSLRSDPLGADPLVEVTGSGVEITKTMIDAQRSVYATAIDAGSGYRSAMITTVVRPDVIAVPDDAGGPLNMSVFPGGIFPPPFATNTGGITTNISGVVMGLEHGPRNRAAYFWLQYDGSRVARLTGPIDESGLPVPNLTISHDWSVFQRYTMVWNEAQGYVEVYSDLGGASSRLFRVPITSFDQMPAVYPARAGGAGDVVGIYGLEGNSNNKATWKNVAVTTDVGFPIIGGARPGFFRTISEGAEFVRLPTDTDPTDADNVCWFTAPGLLIPSPDALGSLTVVEESSLVRLDKPTLGTTYAIYREEPGFLRSTTDGFTVQAKLVAENGQQEQAATGMGITIYDGTSVFQIQLFNDFLVKTVGLRKKGAQDHDIIQYFTPTTPIDWSTSESFRFAVDPRRNLIEFYDIADLNTPLMSVPFDRGTLPDAADFGYVGFTPFIAVGHTFNTDTKGTLFIHGLEYSHFYQAWEGADGLPTASSPAFTATNPGTLSMSGEDLLITTTTGQLSKVSRPGDFAIDRGAVVETTASIISHRPKSRTGTYLMIDDGLRTFALSFTETNIGRFVCVPLRTDIGGFREVVGKDGQAAKLSFVLDWSKPHIYRLELRPYDGFYVFLDNEPSPRIVIPELDYGQLPDSQFPGVPSVAFGQFNPEGSTSKWSNFRTYFSGGYEISFKKNKPDSVLRDELFATQAIVIAYAVDQD